MENYSNSKCPKCESTKFETAEEVPKGSSYKLNFVRCQHCKTVIGITEYYNLGALIHQLAKKLNINIG